MKKLFALVLALTMTALAALSASAAAWEQMQSGEWMVRLDDGSYAKNMWISDGGTGTYYYIGPAGVMLRNNYTPDGYWVGSDGVWQAQWPKRTDYAEPYAGPVYQGIYSYTFFKDTYATGNVHWSMTESYGGRKLATYELYPMSDFSFEIMDIYSGTTLGYVSVDKFRDAVYVSMGNDTQTCTLQ